MKHQKRNFILTFKILFLGQLALSLGLCLSMGVYASEFAGERHNCVLKNDGSIVCWGTSHYGQNTPPTGNDFTQVSADRVNTCALKNDGSIVCWGRNAYGQSTSPAYNDFIQIAAGQVHTCVLRSDGSITCWGNNDYGQSVPPAGNNFVGGYLSSDDINNDQNSDDNNNNDGSSDNNEDCKHAIYSPKERTLTIPFIELPLLNTWNKQPTGEVELIKGVLKQKSKTTDHFRVLSKTVSLITDDSSSSCPATYSFDTGVLSIPYINVPTISVMGGNQFDSSKIEVFTMTMKWESEEKAFVVQEVGEP